MSYGVWNSHEGKDFSDDCMLEMAMSVSFNEETEEIINSLDYEEADGSPV